ncbi:hypothetical protein SDC9_176769 [bioreactor metagenome]|uniref:Uncharacterized protein n=1 Tax=bioreactor metagenome TaxID=1076179 RepID=A0A645GQZ4_9ZZZZ
MIEHQGHRPQSGGPDTLCVFTPPNKRERRTHEDRNHCRPRRLLAGPDHQGRRRPDLPDNLLRFRQHPARCRPVRPESRGQYLHAHHEPDAGRAGKARRRDGRRHCRAVHGLRHGGHHRRDPDHCRSRRQHRHFQHPVRRHL